MTESTEKETRAADLADEVRESAKSGQEAAREALSKFRSTIDEAIRERRETIREDSALYSLRNTIVNAAIELADQLNTARYEFHRSIIHTAERALSKPDD